ncbi:hypothetical protein WA158_002471 [Blastocystis sp. Blastoise]
MEIPFFDPIDFLDILTFPLKDASKSFKSLSEEEVDSLYGLIPKDNGLMKAQFYRLLVYRDDVNRLVKYLQVETVQFQNVCYTYLHIPKLEKKFILQIKSVDQFFDLVNTLSVSLKNYLFSNFVKYCTDVSLIDSILLKESPLLSDSFKNELAYQSSAEYLYTIYIKDTSSVSIDSLQKYKNSHEFCHKVFFHLLEVISSYSPSIDFFEGLTKACCSYLWVKKYTLDERITKDNITQTGYIWLVDTIMKRIEHEEYIEILLEKSFYFRDINENKDTIEEITLYKQIEASHVNICNSNCISIKDLLRELFYYAPKYMIDTYHLFTDKFCYLIDYDVDLDCLLSLYLLFKHYHYDEQYKVMLRLICEKSLFDPITISSKFSLLFERVFTIYFYLYKEDIPLFYQYVIDYYLNKIKSTTLTNEFATQVSNYIRFFHIIFSNDEYKQELDSMTESVLPQLVSRNIDLNTRLSLYSIDFKRVPLDFMYFNGFKGIKKLYPTVYSCEKSLASKNNGYLFNKDADTRSSSIDALVSACIQSKDICFTHRLLHSLLRLYDKDDNLTCDFNKLILLFSPDCLNMNLKEVKNSLGYLTSTIRNELRDDIVEWAKSSGKLDCTLLPSIILCLMFFSIQYPSYSQEYYNFYKPLMNTYVELECKLTSDISFNPYRHKMSVVEWYKNTPFENRMNSKLWTVLEKNENYLLTGKSFKDLEFFKSHYCYSYDYIYVYIKNSSYNDELEYKPITKSITDSILELIVDYLDKTKPIDVLLDTIFDYLCYCGIYNKSTTRILEKKSEYTIKETISTSYYQIDQPILSEMNKEIRDYYGNIKGYSTFTSWYTINDYGYSFYEELPQPSKSINYVSTPKQVPPTKQINKKDISIHTDIYKRIIYKQPNVSQLLFKSNFKDIIDYISSVKNLLSTLTLSSDTYDHLIEVYIHDLYKEFDDIILESYCLWDTELSTLVPIYIPEEELQILYDISLTFYHSFLEMIYFYIYYYQYDRKGKSQKVPFSFHYDLYNVLKVIFNIRLIAKRQNIILNNSIRKVYYFTKDVAPFYNIDMKYDETQPETAYCLDTIDVDFSNYTELIKFIAVTFSNKTIQDIFCPKENHQKYNISEHHPGTLRNIENLLLKICQYLPWECYQYLCKYFLSLSNSNYLVLFFITHYLNNSNMESTAVSNVFDLLVPEKAKTLSVQYIKLLFTIVKHPLVDEILHKKQVPQLVSKWNTLVDSLWSNDSLAKESSFYLVSEIFEDIWESDNSMKYFDMIGKMNGSTNTQNFIINSFMYLSLLFDQYDASVLSYSKWIQDTFEDLPIATRIYKDMKSKNISRMETERATYIHNIILEVYFSLRKFESSPQYELFNVFILSNSLSEENILHVLPIAKESISLFLLNDSSINEVMYSASFMMLTLFDQEEFIQLLRRNLLFINTLILLSKDITNKTLFNTCIPYLNDIKMNKNDFLSIIEKNKISTIFRLNIDHYISCVFYNKELPELLNMIRSKISVIYESILDLIHTNNYSLLKFYSLLGRFIDDNDNYDFVSFCNTVTTQQFPIYCISSLCSNPNDFYINNWKESLLNMEQYYLKTHSTISAFIYIYLINSKQYKSINKNLTHQNIMFITKLMNDTSIYSDLNVFSNFFSNIL